MNPIGSVLRAVAPSGFSESAQDEPAQQLASSATDQWPSATQVEYGCVDWYRYQEAHDQQQARAGNFALK
jgi:hypothetical protein